MALSLSPKDTSAVVVNPANVGLSVVATPWFKALTEASLVNSESIKAPAAVTLAVSVTSALASIPFSLEWSASVKTLESVALSTSVLISAAVWSAVAPASIPSNLVPSVATSRPSMRPSVVRLPDTTGVAKVLLESV